MHPLHATAIRHIARPVHFTIQYSPQLTQKKRKEERKKSQMKREFIAVLQQFYPITSIWL